MGGVNTDVEYCVRKDEACQYDSVNEQFDDGVPEKTVTVNTAYINAHGSIVRERLKMAGVRLAGLLNSAFSESESPTDFSAVLIRALLPNPNGPDPGNETVTLYNSGARTVPLAGWKLSDRSGNVFELSGEIGPTSELEIRLVTNSLPLNNSGDEVRLIAPGEQVVSTVRYDRAASGELLHF